MHQLRLRGEKPLSTDAKSYFVMGWLFGTLAGSVVIAGALFPSDSPLPHPIAWVLVGVALVTIAAASALALAIGAKSQEGRVLAIAALGLTVLLAMVAFVAS